MSSVNNSTKKHKLINLCPVTDGKRVVLDYYSQYNNDCIVISTNNDLGIKVCKPNEALLMFQTLHTNNVIIYNIYPFDAEYGYIIEIIFALYSKKCRIIYILYFYDYSDLSGWIEECEIINDINELNVYVNGFLASKNDFLFESKLNYKVLSLISKQTIIKTATIKCCISGVKILIQKMSFNKKKCYINSFKDLLLQESVKKGIGYCHFKMENEDKEKVMSLYNEGYISCLITTINLSHLKCDTYIVKSTKKYTKDGYKEYILQEIVDFAKCIHQNGRLHILTEKGTSQYYTTIFCNKKLPTYFDYAKNNQITKPCNFSILENHLPEFILYLLQLQIKSKDVIISLLQQTFFYYNVIGLKKDFDLDILVDSIIQDLICCKFIDNRNNLNEGLSLVFFSHKITYTQFSMFTKNYLSVEKLANDVAQIDNNWNNCKETFYKKYITCKIDKSSETYKKYLKNIEMVIKIKKAIGYNLSVVTILFCQLLSDKCTKKITEINTDTNLFYNDSAKITFDSTKITICVSCVYFLVVENDFTVILETQIQDNFSFFSTENSYDLYLLNVYDYSKSIVLKKNNTNVTKNVKYYCYFSKYQLSKNKIVKENLCKENCVKNVEPKIKHEYVNGVCVTLYHPKNVKQNM